MNRNNILTGIMFLVLASLAGADYVSTSITTDGTMVLASSGHDENGSYASRVMTSDDSDLSRTLTGGEKLSSDVAVKGAGPILVSDYADAVHYTIPDNLACVFLNHAEKQPVQRSNLYTGGILNRGSYITSRESGASGLTGGTDANGSGMIDLGSQTVGNTSLSTRGFVAGNITVRDFVKYGGKL